MHFEEPSQGGTESSEEHAILEAANLSPAILDTPEIAAYGDGQAMPRLISPINIDEFNDIWSRGFDQSHDLIDPNLANFNDLTPSGPNLKLKHQNDGLSNIGDLQASILTDLELVKSCRTADKCPQAINPESSVTGQNVLIGRMLEHSTSLLDLLNGFRSVGTDRDSSRLSCDTPTMFTLLSCYVCLVRIYRTIFSCILDSMPFLLGIQDPVPQLFPGMHLGGWKLAARVDLQIQILVQISEDMMAKIDSAFGLSEDSMSGKDSKTAWILRMMLEEEASEQPPLYERRGECGTLKELLGSLKKATLRGP
jgi:hypothetical protein